MPNYPSKALQEYVLKSDVAGFVIGGDGTGPAGTTGFPGANGTPGTRTPVQSATAPAVVSTGTIATVGLTVSRVSPTVDITAVILASGTIAGQEIIVLNESGFGITFATAATSHVATGTQCVIPARLHRAFVWDSVTTKWYAGGQPGALSAGGTFGAGTFGANTFGG